VIADKIKQLVTGAIVEKVYTLEERAQHFRKHISNMNERLDRLEESINKIMDYLERRK